MERQHPVLRPAGGEGRRSKAEAPPESPLGEVGVSAVGYISGRDCTRRNDSELEQQAALIRRFCACRGWGLVEVVGDVEVPKRRRVRRPALTYAIDRLSDGEASCLVVAELKRLCPSVAELGLILDALERVDARLVSLNPAFDTGTPVGRASLRLLRAVSGWERGRRAEMSSAARAKAASSQAIEPKLKRQIQRMRRAGLTLQAIADALNEEGVPTARGGSQWRPSSVQAALGYRRPPLFANAHSVERVM